MTKKNDLGQSKEELSIGESIKIVSMDKTKEYSSRLLVSTTLQTKHSLQIAQKLLNKRDSRRKS